jgi:hypothetical protein
MKVLKDPDFLYAAPDMTACAAFCKESRMKFANTTKLHRKSEGVRRRKPARHGKARKKISPSVAGRSSCLYYFLSG